MSELVIEDASGDLRPVEPDPTKFVRIEARGLRSTSVHGSPSLEVHGDATADAESGEAGDFADVRRSNIKSLALGESVRAVEHQEASLAAAPRIAG